MAIRQRKPAEKKQQEKNYRLPSHRHSKLKNRSCRVCLIIFSFVGSIIGIMAWNYYSKMGLYTPLPVSKAVDLMRDHDEDLQRLWGTYR